MLSLRSRAGLLATKVAAGASRSLGRGGGTAVGGLVGLKIQPNLAGDLARQLNLGCVLITGTNGKTTTSHLISAIAREAGLTPIANASGSNLMRGLTGALAAAASVNGDFGGDSWTLG